MQNNPLDSLEDFLKTMVGNQQINQKDIPQLDLYMDQVLTFLNSHLNAFGREDKDLTKTMVNNYAKNKLIPPPEKKKYSKDHILLLIFIYYLKNVLSMSEIQSILTPVTDHFSPQGEPSDLVGFYEKITSMNRSSAESILHSLPQSMELVKERFPVTAEEESDTIQTLAMICLFSYDVYLKKSMIEHLIRNFHPEGENETGHPGRKEKKENQSEKD